MVGFLLALFSRKEIGTLVRAIFETGTILDVVKKAARIAPTKGAAFAKAAGLLIELKPNDSPNTTVSATNLNVYYREWTDAVAIEGMLDTTWRVPAALLAQLLGTFPVSGGSTCIFEVDEQKAPGLLEVRAGKSKTILHLLDASYFPQWEGFDPSGLKDAPGFAARMSQVSWACDKPGSVPFMGVHVDGRGLAATDKYRLARVDCQVPVDSPVILPPDVVAPLLRNADVKLAVYDGKFYMMPDEATQIVSVTIDGEFPNLEQVQKRDWPQTVKVSAASIKTIIDRMMLLVGSDRFPRLDITLGDERMHMRLSVLDVGSTEDVIDLSGQAIHDDFTLYFQPRILMSALTASPNDKVSIGYDPSNSRRPIYVDGGSGYEAWVAPRVAEPSTNPNQA